MSKSGPFLSENPQLELPIERGKVKKLSPEIFVRTSRAKPTAVYETYWRFAWERQEIFFKRFKDAMPPWTNDPVLQNHKFTNVYRASDRVSQYLIKEVIYKGDQSADELFFRTLLFKFFNRIETWELLLKRIGEVSYLNFSVERYDQVLTDAIDSGVRLYSAAYIMPSGGRNPAFKRKHRMHLWLLRKMMSDKLPEQLASAPSMQRAFELIRAYPSIGDFLAFQYVTDLNYSNLLSFNEMDFVSPGPGALNGIHKCFSDLGGLTESGIIRLVADRQIEEFGRLGLAFRNLWGRPMQLIDCQNVFCEVDKYARVVHPEIVGISKRTRIKQSFRPNPSLIEYSFPPKWNLDKTLF